MNISDFPAVAELMETRNQIERDLALLDGADERNLRITGVELLWNEVLEKQFATLFHADGRARLWADDKLHAEFSAEMRKLVRIFLLKDLDHCHQELSILGVETGGQEIDEH